MNYDEIGVDWSEETDASTPPLELGSGDKQVFNSKGLVRVEEESTEYKLIKKSFLGGMDYLGQVISLVAVHKNKICDNLRRQARSESFGIFSMAVANKCGGNANVRYAWYGGSLHELLEIVSAGFSFRSCSNSTEEVDSHGFGIHLFPAKFSIDGAMCAVEDEDGLRHVLLCRVILGTVEVVAADSKQSHPSSEHYDSGVDNISAPTKYIIWTPFMNSHIHPDYIISFKYTGSEGSSFLQNPTYPNMVAKLSKYLEPLKMALLVKNYRHGQERKISRKEWFLNVREIVGDGVLGLMMRSLVGNVQQHT